MYMYAISSDVKKTTSTFGTDCTSKDEKPRPLIRETNPLTVDKAHLIWHACNFILNINVKNTSIHLKSTHSSISGVPEDT